MSDKELYSSDRSFQLWRYTVSHSQALLRSNKSDTEHTRLEVLFKAVGYIQVPTALDGLRITEARRDSVDLDGLDISPSSDQRCFRIQSNTGSGVILALAVYFAEDGGDYSDPSSLFIDGVR